MLLRIPALKPLEVKGRCAAAAAASPAQLLTGRLQHNAFRFGRLLCKWTFLSNASWCTVLFWLLLKSVQRAFKQTNASCWFFWQNLCFCSAWSEMESLDWCLCRIRDFKAWRDPGSNSCTQHTAQGLRIKPKATSFQKKTGFDLKTCSYENPTTILVKWFHLVK